jgi:hypothetical protein
MNRPSRNCRWAGSGRVTCAFSPKLKFFENLPHPSACSFPLASPCLGNAPPAGNCPPPLSRKSLGFPKAKVSGVRSASPVREASEYLFPRPTCLMHCWAPSRAPAPWPPPSRETRSASGSGAHQNWQICSTRPGRTVAEAAILPGRGRSPVPDRHWPISAPREGPAPVAWTSSRRPV